MEGKYASRTFTKISLICASLAVVLGLMTFVGWISGLSLLASVRAKYIPMAPSTALCFALIGSGLIAQLRKPWIRWVPRLLAAIVLGMAIAKLLELFAGFRFEIDAWFVRNPGLFGAVRQGEWRR